MSSTNRTLIIILLTAAAAVVYWFLLLTPKQEEIATLDDQIAQLHASIAESQQAAAIGNQAKENFEADYAQLVTLGKAVPDGDEQGALLVQLNELGVRNDAFFSSIILEGSGSSSGAPTPPPAASSPTQPSVSDVPAESSSGSSPAPATEASVAALPLGAQVGSAGFGVMPYSLLFEGNFFKLADFIAAINGLVTTDSQGRIQVDGRLITINGFSLNPADDEGDLSNLTGNFSITTFVTPAAQGLMAGATPAGPGTGGEGTPVLTGGTP